MLQSDLHTDGGSITISGETLQVDGSAARLIASGDTVNGVSTGGAINLSQVSKITGLGPLATLTVNSRGKNNGGSIRLGDVTATAPQQESIA